MLSTPPTVAASSQVPLVVPPGPPAGPPVRPPETVQVFGLPLARLTAQQALDHLEALIAAGRPGYFITANVHYAMLQARDPRVPAATAAAALVLADGMPLVWWSRLRGTPLPERVAGSDLVYAVSQRAAARGYRLFLLGGEPGIAAEAGRVLAARYPGLVLAGTESPPFRPLSAEETAAMIGRIRAARPDILLVALGQPKGELWLLDHAASLGVPVCAQVGASLDFVAGRVRRAPRLFQVTGLEWLYRILQEPRRMLPRYAANLGFLAGAVLRDLPAVLRWGRPGR